MVGHEPDGRDLALSDAAQTRPVVTRQAVGHGGGGRFGIIAFRPDQRHAILAVERHSAVAEEPDEQQQYARCKDYAAEKHQRRFQVFIPRRCGQQTVYDQQYDARKRQTKGYDFRFASFDDDPVRQRIKQLRHLILIHNDTTYLTFSISRAQNHACTDYAKAGKGA